MMKLDEAIEVVKDYAACWTDGDILAGAAEMKDETQFLSRDQRIALRIFMQAGEEMFAC